MKNITKQKLSNLAADEIVRYIMDNDLQPKDKLPTEKDISERLNIGRTSVREGLMKLESLGLLRKQQGYGIFINEVTLESYFNFMQYTPLTDFVRFDRQDVFDLLDLRFSLESTACLKAATKMNDKDLERLKQIYNEMTGIIKSPEDYINLDLKFHGWIIKLSGNKITNFIYDIIGDLLSRQFQITFNPQNIGNIHHDHKKIVESLITRNKSEIITALDLHFNHGPKYSE